MVDLKIVQSDWPRAFWTISQEEGFSQYRICVGTQQIINFHYRTNSVKINDQIFIQIKKALFLLNFPNFGAKLFFKKLWLCHTQLHKGF